MCASIEQFVQAPVEQIAQIHVQRTECKPKKKFDLRAG
jgi:hypothetical protein